MTSRKIERGAAPAMCNWHSHKHPPTHTKAIWQVQKKKMKKRLDLFVFIVTHLVGRDTHPTINSEQYQPNCILL